MQQQQDPFADFAARATRAYERIAAAFVRDLERMRPELEAAAEDDGAAADVERMAALLASERG